MRSLSRHLGASSGLAVLLLAASFVSAPVASAVTYATTASQSAPGTLRSGSLQSVEASLRVDGTPTGR
jgi:hypothetical protein